MSILSEDICNQIKFRIFDTENKQMGKVFTLKQVIQEMPFELLNADVVMRFTGLLDKQEEDIYEGDVVECCSAYGGIFKAEIVFCDGCFEIQEPQGKDGVFRDYLKCLTCNHAASVIGNIYENRNFLGV